MTNWRFYLYIFFICFVILGASLFSHYRKFYFENRENFDTGSDTSSTTSNTIVLLGDSILKNNNYVGTGESVEDLLSNQQSKSQKIVVLAKDDATISSTYSQLDAITSDLNTDKTSVFLSIGGNDIINALSLQGDQPVNPNVIYMIFYKYQQLVDAIRTKLPKVNIILLDLYFPLKIDYTKYYRVIKSWNKMLVNYVANSPNNITGLIKISDLLTHSSDFASDIEPSESGGKKIVDQIISMV
jgi:lysophospholipase L1-like esterase